MIYLSLLSLWTLKIPFYVSISWYNFLLGWYRFPSIHSLLKIWLCILGLVVDYWKNLWLYVSYAKNQDSYALRSFERLKLNLSLSFSKIINCFHLRPILIFLPCLQNNKNLETSSYEAWYFQERPLSILIYVLNDVGQVLFFFWLIRLSFLSW